MVGTAGLKHGCMPSRRILMDNSQKILIIQLKRAGDIVLTTPVAALVKRRWPQAKVDFLVEKGFAPLLENNPSIDTVQVYDKDRSWQTLMRIRAQRYDQVFDFQSSPRSALAVLASGAAYTAGYQVPFWGRFYRQTVRRPGGSLSVVQGKLSLLEPVMGPVADAPLPQMFLSQEERLWAQTVIISPRPTCGERASRTEGTGAGEGSLDRSDMRYPSPPPSPLMGRGEANAVIGLVPTHRRTARRWYAESFGALARLLDQAGYAVWLFWGPGEREYVENIRQQAPHASMIPSTSLRQMAALLARCELVVSNDNGPMHIAAAVGVPTVTVYGPTDPHAWNPGGSRHIALQAAGLRCLGCNLNACPFGHECMRQVTPEQVLAACQDLLARTSTQKPLPPLRGEGGDGGCRRLTTVPPTSILPHKGGGGCS